MPGWQQQGRFPVYQAEPPGLDGADTAALSPSFSSPWPVIAPGLIRERRLSLIVSMHGAEGTKRWSIQDTSYPSPEMGKEVNPNEMQAACKTINPA